MANESNFRSWDELLPDVLGLILEKLPIEEVLTVVPTVCKSWNQVLKGPYGWRVIDVENWSRHREPTQIDRLLQLLTTRSCGSVQKLCAFGLPSDSSFSFIANNAKSLETLKLPGSRITNLITEQVAKFSKLTTLDLSYCMEIGAPALEAIGKHCKFLAALRRTMHPSDVIDGQSQDDEAVAIASTMPKLKHLEISYLVVGTASIIQIITSCSYLELLDVRGCWNVDLDENFVNEFPKLNLLGPVVPDPYYDMIDSDFDSSSNYSHSSGSSGNVAWYFEFEVADDEDDEVPDGLWEDE